MVSTHERHPPTVIPLSIATAVFVPPAARATLRSGLPPDAGPRRTHVLQWLQETLSTELVCVVRRDHRSERASPANPDPVVVPWNARFRPSCFAPFIGRGRDPGRRLDEAPALDGCDRSMRPGARPSAAATESLNQSLRASLVAERVAIATYRQVIRLIGDHDVPTRCLVEALLADELEHVAKLEAWLADG